MHGTNSRFSIAIALGFLFLVTAQRAAAQEANASTRAAARDLGYEGVKAFQAKDFERASDRLNRAYQVLKVPSLGLWLGRCWAQQGKLVEATELWLDVTRLSVDGGEVTVQKQAQKDAAKERDLLLPRLAKLTIVIAGAAQANTHVTLDDHDVSPALLGTANPVNPGRHVVRARSVDGVEDSKSLELADGATQSVELVLNAKPAQAVPVAPAPNATATRESAVSASSVAPAASSNSPPVVGASPTASAPGRPASAPATNVPAAPKDSAAEPMVPLWVGYTSLVVGGVGIAAGSLLGLAAHNKANSSPLSDRCNASRCAPDVSSNVDDYNRLRTLSTVSFGIGAVGLVSGVVLTWLLPKTAREVPVAFDVLSTRHSQEFTVRLPF